MKILRLCFVFVTRRKIRLKTSRFFAVLVKVFYSIAVSFLSVYVYTPSGRRTTISALNPFAPDSVLIKNLPTIGFNCIFYGFALILLNS